MLGRQSLLTFLTIVTRWSRSTSNFYALIGQNLKGEFMRKIYAASGNLLTDSWSWQGFVSSCDVFNWLFLLDIPNETELLTRLFCVIHGWFIYCAFGLEMHSLSASLEIRFRMASFSKKNELTHLPLLEAYKEGWKVSSDSGLTWWPSGAASRLLSLSNYCLWCVCVFFLGLLRSSVVYAA